MWTRKSNLKDQLCCVQLHPFDFPAELTLHSFLQSTIRERQYWIKFEWIKYKNNWFILNSKVVFWWQEVVCKHQLEWGNSSMYFGSHFVNVQTTEILFDSFHKSITPLIRMVQPLNVFLFLQFPRFYFNKYYWSLNVLTFDVLSCICVTTFCKLFIYKNVCHTFVFTWQSLQQSNLNHFQSSLRKRGIFNAKVLIARTLKSCE